MFALGATRRVIKSFEIRLPDVDAPYVRSLIRFHFLISLLSFGKSYMKLRATLEHHRESYHDETDQ